MACEKYSKLIADEALCGVGPKRGVDLRAHLAQCVSCREEFDHVTGIAAIVDGGVEMLVAGEPSPQFANRLRARVANEPGPTQLDWRAWIPVGGGAFVLALLLVSVMIRTSRPNNQTASHLVQVPASPDVVVSGDAKRPPNEVNRAFSGLEYRPVRANQPEVLVPPGQLAAVMRFANVMNEGRVDGEQIVIAQQRSGQPLKIDTIQILPLSIPQLDNGSDTSEIPGGF